MRGNVLTVCRTSDTGTLYLSMLLSKSETPMRFAIPSWRIEKLDRSGGTFENRSGYPLGFYPAVSKEDAYQKSLSDRRMKGKSSGLGISVGRSGAVPSARCTAKPTRPNPG